LKILRPALFKETRLQDATQSRTGRFTLALTKTETLSRCGRSQLALGGHLGRSNAWPPDTEKSREFHSIFMLRKSDVQRDGGFPLMAQGADASHGQVNLDSSMDLGI
jgi:hypothetical protein